MRDMVESFSACLDTLYLQYICFLSLSLLLYLVPMITEQPDSLENVAPGKPAEFAVKAIGKNLTYTWHHQTAEQLLANEKRVVVGDTQILQIDKVKPSHEGYYVCTICNTTGGIVETNPAQLTTCMSLYVLCCRVLFST